MGADQAQSSGVHSWWVRSRQLAVTGCSLPVFPPLTELVQFISPPPHNVCFVSKPVLAVQPLFPYCYIHQDPQFCSMQSHSCWLILCCAEECQVILSHTDKRHVPSLLPSCELRTINFSHKLLQIACTVHALQCLHRIHSVFYYVQIETTIFRSGTLHMGDLTVTCMGLQHNHNQVLVVLHSMLFESFRVYMHTNNLTPISCWLQWFAKERSRKSRLVTHLWSLTSSSEVEVQRWAMSQLMFATAVLQTTVWSHKCTNSLHKVAADQAKTTKVASKLENVDKWMFSQMA